MNFRYQLQLKEHELAEHKKWGGFRCYVPLLEYLGYYCLPENIQEDLVTSV